ncbi:PEP-CTERM sorting domain-containing protein [Aquabacterium sp.]|uniref:PEP-CTERM sorting domain-containing protein n=1 Tax=Aquabacterium sp. TaxID=1872578 RepID=UPI0025C235CF|nr:PEP-CTERM sorting domain-containing protein [Aquabacterium sp.]
MSKRTGLHALKPLAASIGIGLFLMGQAQAATEVSATASYNLGGAGVNVLDSGVSTSSVDVLTFPYDYSGNSAGIHTYGSPGGDFGSRSSGAGNYDVTGLFTLTQSITNTSAVAQHATFNFYITPGLLQNEIRSDLSSNGYYVAAGINFNILRNGASVWNSQAALRTDASGTTYSHSGANILTQSDATTYTIAGGAYSVDLGVINAGQSINLQYTLSTYANGNAPSTGYFTAPSQTVNVPEQTIFHPEHTYEQWVSDGYGGYGGYGDGGYGGYGGYGGGHYESVTVPAYTEVLPAHTVTTPSYTSYGQASGSHASSGDPFSIDWDGSPSSVYDATGNFAKPPTNPFEVKMSAVPEPQAYAMVLGGLTVVGALARRRRDKQQA